MQVGQGGEGAAPAAAPAAAEGTKQAAEQAAGPASPFGACGGGGMLEFGLWMVFLFGLMYFLLIRPQKKQKQKQDELLRSLKKGDRVVTSAGILGTVRNITEAIIAIEVADGVQIRVRREHVAGLQVETKQEEGKTPQAESKG
jgi:preprotein translocase subunit YajC